MQNTESWPLIEKLFEQAKALELSERLAFLNQHCPDPGIRKEVEALLSASDETTRDGIGVSPRPIANPLEPAQTELAPGQNVGPYALLAKVAEGGMGEVWRARRSDGAIEREVALKLPRIALLDPGQDRHIQSETALLASLNHPHITQLYDAGLTEARRPYMAMELVDGEPIDAYCRHQRLNPRARIKLFLQVVSAVNFAHSQFVLHRDIKPGNVLVGPDGQAKLLDFGVAKLLLPGNAGSVEVTRSVGLALTPGYASPEQLRGDNLTIASDIYALGVLLYELLCGHRPHDAQAIESLWRAHHPVEAPRLSSRVDGDHAAQMGLSLGAARHRLAGDLEAILAKALKARPEQRYASARELAEDLERYLAGHPTLARPLSPLARLAKFARRNPVPSGLAFTLLSSVVLGSAAVAWQAHKAQQAAMAEARAARTASSVVNFLVEDLLGAANPWVTGKPNIRVREVMDRAAERVELSMADQVDERAEIHRTLGRVYKTLSAFDEAEAQTAEAYRLYQELGQADKLLMVLFERANLAMAKGETELAADLLNELETRMPEGLPSDHELRLNSDFVRLRLLLDKGEFEEVIKRGLPLQQAVRAKGPDWSSTGIEVTWVIGMAYGQFGRMDDLVELVEESSALMRTRHGENHPFSLQSEIHLMSAWREAGQVERAVAGFESLLPRIVAALGADHEVVQLSRADYGRTLVYQGNYEAAIAQLEPAAAYFSQSFVPTQEDTMVVNNVLAVAYDRLERYDDSMPIHLRLVELATASQGPLHPYTMIYRSNAARALARVGQVEQARERINQVLEDARGVFAAESYQMGLFWGADGAIYERAEEWKAASASFRKARDIMSATRGPDFAFTEWAAEGLARAEAALDKKVGGN